MGTHLQTRGLDVGSEQFHGVASAGHDRVADTFLLTPQDHVVPAGVADEKTHLGAAFGGFDQGGCETIESVEQERGGELQNID